MQFSGQVQVNGKIMEFYNDIKTGEIIARSPSWEPEEVYFVAQSHADFMAKFSQWVETRLYG